MNDYSDIPKGREIEVMAGTLIMLAVVALAGWGICEAFRVAVS
jgi:hypothetical protein